VRVIINDTQHSNACDCAECHYGECRDLFTVMLSVVMLSVVEQNAVMLSVVAPSWPNSKLSYYFQGTKTPAF
jgi:hypothetical protein